MSLKTLRKAFKKVTKTEMRRAPPPQVDVTLDRPNWRVEFMTRPSGKILCRQIMIVDVDAPTLSRATEAAKAIALAEGCNGFEYVRAHPITIY